MKQQELEHFLSKLDQRKQVLDSYRPLPAVTANSLRDKLSLDWIYNSNAIEGNTLTLSETKVVIEDGITIGKKSLREHFEAINHRDAILFVEDLVQKNADINEWNIKNIHQLVYKNINDREAGQYRNGNVIISGASFIPPDYIHVPEQMSGLIEWYNNEGQNLHPVDRAAQLHTRFVEIHPFIDGNGRTARLLLNLELMRNGYTPAIITKEERLDYYASLEKACVERDYTDFTYMVGRAVENSMGIYLRVITGIKPQPLESKAPDIDLEL